MCLNRQVIAPFFIIQRAAENKGIRNDSVASKDIGSIIFAQGVTDESESLLESDSLNPMGTDGDTHEEADDGAETAVGGVPSREGMETP